MNIHPINTISTPALYCTSEIRQIEYSASRTLPPNTLMQRAGLSIANKAIELLVNRPNTARILCIAGPGNNGGDALEAAYHLASTALDVCILLHPDLPQSSSETYAAYQRARATPARFIDISDLSALPTTEWDLVIDGLFGIGLTRPIEEPLYTLVKTINHCSCPVLAIDLPSGLNPDTGCVIGPSGIAVHATHTLTFIAAKPGLYTADGRDYSGIIQIDTLGIETHYFTEPTLWLNEPDLFRTALPHRFHNSHKGLFGEVAIIGGAHGMTGAAILAGRAALHLGAGKTHVIFIGPTPSYDPQQPELMCQEIGTYDFSSTALVLGPGMGTSTHACSALEQAIHSSSVLVLDADALNLIATKPQLKTQLIQRQASTLITPHPLEAARLLNLSPSQIQKNRLSSARQLATQLNAITILKGSGTLIAHPDGYLVVNPTGNPALATAGTGDVLAGMCGALLAQKCSVWETALAATWLHGMAADILTKSRGGPIGLTAGELILSAREYCNSTFFVR